MALPAYAAAGTGVRDDTTVAIPYPSGISAGHLLLLQVLCYNIETVTTPADWTLLYGPDTAAAGVQGRQYIYAKSATGSESGTLTVTASNSDIGGRIYRFTGWANASPITANFEAGATANGSDASIEIPSVTTTGTDELVVAFIGITDDNAVASATGETGGDYTEAVAEYAQSTGADFCIQLQTAGKAAAGTISGGVVSMGAADGWVVRAFAIKSSVGMTGTLAATTAGGYS